MHESVVDEIKHKLNIVDVIGRYITLKKSGANYKGVCPFHGEKTPSFMVNQERQLFKCFGCGESGDIFAFVMKQENIDFPSALALLASQAGVVLPEKSTARKSDNKDKLFAVNDLAAKYFHQILAKHPAGKSAWDYLAARGLTSESRDVFLIGYAPSNTAAISQLFQKYNLGGLQIKNAGAPDRFKNRIMFPFRDVIGRVVGFSGRALGEQMPKYLNTAETTLFHKNRYIYGLFEAKKNIAEAGKIVLVEGQLDVVFAHQAGTPFAVATSGTALTNDHLQLLRRYSDTLILGFDGDTAGKKATERAIQMALPHEFEVSVVAVPDGKDPGDLASENPDQWRRLVAEPISAIEWLFRYYFPNTEQKPSATERQKIFAAMFPYLQLIPDVVTQTYAIQRLALVLGLTHEKAVAEAFAEWQEKQTTKVGKSDIAEKTEETVLPVKEENEVVKKEKTLLGLLVVQPQLLSHKDLYIGDEDFTNDTLQSLYITLIDWYNRNTTQSSIDLFLRHVGVTYSGTTVKALQNLLFDTQTQFADFTPEQLFQEYSVLIQSIRQRRRDRRIATFAQRIAAAEATNNRAEVVKLMAEMQSVLKKGA